MSIQHSLSDHPADVVAVADEVFRQYDPHARGKRPSITRAACLYLAYISEGVSDPPSQAELADEFDCSTVSIRKRRYQVIEDTDLFDSSYE